MDAHMEGIERRYISSDVKFYTVSDVIDMTGWSEKTVLSMFRDPEFPAAEFGRTKIVEAHALIEYFSVRRDKCRGTEKSERLKGELCNELKRRIRQES